MKFIITLLCLKCILEQVMQSDRADNVQRKSHGHMYHLSELSLLQQLSQVGGVFPGMVKLQWTSLTAH